MNHRRHAVALGANTLVLGLLLTGCGGYESNDPVDTGAGTGTTQTTTDSSLSGTGQTADTSGATASDTGAGGQATASTGGTSTATDISGGTMATGGTATDVTDSIATAMGGAGGSGQTGVAGAVGAQGGTGGVAATTGGEEVACPDPLPPAEACGGDVAGTWAVATCTLAVTGEVDMLSLGLGCMTAPVTGSLQVAGTWTANGDGTYTDSTTTSGEQTIELEAGCLEISGTKTTCDRVGGPMQSSLGYATVECVDNTETAGCTCSATIDQTGGGGVVSPEREVLTSANYTAADNMLVLTDGRYEALYSYCVMDNTMVMTPESSKTGTVAPIVLQKQ